MLRTTKMTTTRRRWQAVALLGGLLLITTAFAGCTEAPTATAAQLQPTADSHASGWDPDADLIMVIGTEGTFQMQSLLGEFDVDSMDSDAMDGALSADFWTRIHEDPEPGDGRGMFWLYVYRAGDGEGHFVVVVDKDREVVYEDETQASDLGTPIGAYTVDSDQAVAIARQENSHLDQAVATGSFGFVVSLFRDDPGQNPAWIVAGGGGSADSGGGGMVLIDAVTGAVLMNEGGSGMPRDWADNRG